MKNIHIIALIGLSSIALVDAAGLWDGLGNAVKSTGEFATNTVTLGAYDRNKEKKYMQMELKEKQQDKQQRNAENRRAKGKAKNHMTSRPMSDQSDRMYIQTDNTTEINDQEGMSNKDQQIMIQAQEANDGAED